MTEPAAVALVFCFMIVGGVILVYAGLRHRTKILEMAHRERLAMIERGLTPVGDLDGTAQVAKAQRTARSNKLLSAGIFIVGLGLGLATLIAFASREPEIAVGIGGAIAVVGGSLIVTAVLVHGRQVDDIAADSYSTRNRTLPPTDRSV